MPTRDLVRARHPGLKQGYESYYLRGADPAGGHGFWIRYTVHRKPGQAPSGSLWFTYFDAALPGPVAAKSTTERPQSGGLDWIRIDDATLRPGHARGAIEVADAVPVSWDLEFTGEEQFAHLPRDWMYDAPLPRTKPVSLHPAATFGGHLVLGERAIVVDGWPGMVGHNWGSEHAERWIWLHGTGLDGDDPAWVDVVLARLRIGTWTTPWSGFGGLCVDGERHRLGGLGRVRSTHVDEHPDHLAFSLPGAAVRVHGNLTARRSLFVGWEYADPDGARHDVVHCSIADLDLTLERVGSSPRRLRASGVAAYELGMREHDHGVPIQPFPDG